MVRESRTLQGHFLYNSSVAQLVERVAVNHLVAGSSPARGASISNQVYLLKVLTKFLSL